MIAALITLRVYLTVDADVVVWRNLIMYPFDVTWTRKSTWKKPSQSAFTFLKLTIETLEQGVKYVQS